MVLGARRCCFVPGGCLWFFGFPLGSLWVRASGPTRGSLAWDSHRGVSGYGVPIGESLGQGLGGHPRPPGPQGPLVLRAWGSHRGVFGYLVSTGRLLFSMLDFFPRKGLPTLFSGPYCPAQAVYGFGEFFIYGSFFLDRGI